MSTHSLNLSNLNHDAAAFLDSRFDASAALPVRSVTHAKQKRSLSLPNLLDSAIAYLTQQYLSLESPEL